MRVILVGTLLCFSSAVAWGQSSTGTPAAKAVKAKAAPTSKPARQIPLYDLDSEPAPTPPAKSALARILKTQVLRVCVRADMPPFGYFAGGNLTGFDVHLARMLAVQLSTYYKKNLLLSLSVVTANARVSSLTNKGCDIVAAAFSYTAERAKKIAFSKRYLRTDKVLLAHEKPKAKDPVIAVVRGTTSPPGFKGKRRVFRNYGEIIMAMESGDVDYAIADRPVAMHMNRSVTTSYRVQKSLKQIELYALGVNKNNVALLKAVNRALTELASSGRLAYLQRQWL